MNDVHDFHIDEQLIFASFLRKFDLLIFPENNFQQQTVFLLPFSTSNPSLQPHSLAYTHAHTHR